MAKAKKEKVKTPDCLEFCKAVNDGSVTTYDDVVELLKKRGFVVTRPLVVSRYHNYTDKKRTNGPINLKPLQGKDKGRSIKGADINAQLAALGLEYKPPKAKHDK